MNSRESRAPSRSGEAARAESLVRSLAGVAGASVEADAGGAVRAVRVLAEDGAHPREVARNVQSALFAALRITVDPARITVAPRDGKGPAKAPLAPRPDSPRRAPASSGSKGSGAPAAKARTAPGRRPPNGRARPGAAAPPAAPPAEMDVDATPFPEHAAEPAAPAPPPHAHAAGAEPAPRVNVRLARVDLEYPGPGRVAARVTLAAGHRILVGDAAGEDTPAGRLDAVARAVISARPAADTTACELEGVRLLEVAGRPYAFVALRTAGAARIDYRADTAAADGPVEHAVALATLGAIL
ncbi:MAG TPA: hypothetical protein VFQ38_02535, partial [Longimicrobiales bacterium]|nr:hypothetical protein [Longimicrobiales bacterium]